MAAPAAKESPVSRLLPFARKERVDALDLARGFAVTLMILSHGVKGLLSFEQFPPWGLVPVHLITKFSSSLFILVFGISLAVVYGRASLLPSWPAKRKRLLLRGLTIFFWYKVLTIAEMTPLYNPEEILSTLLYQAFPVYVEILGFYAIALLWVPFTLPLWMKSPLTVKLLFPLGLAAASYGLYHHFDFWGLESLQALLVEHERHYTWGQLARAPLVFLGFLLGELVIRERDKGTLRHVALFAGASALLFGGYYLSAGSRLGASLLAISRNEGKHPPELEFMLFSLGGAFGLLALAFLGGRSLARWLKPITLIGKDALQAFICHIFVIFVFYRYLFGYWHAVSYERALGLTAVVFFLTAFWNGILEWKRKSERS